jgi:hypothetical protein
MATSTAMLLEASAAAAAASALLDWRWHRRVDGIDGYRVIAAIAVYLAALMQS